MSPAKMAMLEVPPMSSLSTLSPHECNDASTFVRWTRCSRIKKFRLVLWVVTIFVLMCVEKYFAIIRSETPQDETIKYKNETNRVSGVSHLTKPTLAPTKAAWMLHPANRPATGTTVPIVATMPKSIGSGSGSINHPLSPTVVSRPQTPVAPVEDLPAATQSFVEQHCDLKNVPNWIPNGEAEAWKLRTPYVILAGVWNGGVKTLSQALQLHPQIRKHVGVPDFFLPRQFYKYLSSTTIQGGSSVVKVFPARQRMYAQVYSKITTPSFKENYDKSVAMDVSPGYLFYAAQTSVSIQCVSPWAKTVILLRDPVERVYHQWLFGREKLGLRLSLEKWMAQELKAMQSAGLISSSSNTNSIQGRRRRGRPRLLHQLLLSPGHDDNTTVTLEDDDLQLQELINDNKQSNYHGRMLLTQKKKDAEREAWKRYQSQRNLAGAIGRSMYVLQLEEWFGTLVAAGKVPKEEVFLMRSEVWEDQPYREYEQLISFLGLAPFTPSVLDPLKTFEKQGTNSKMGYVPPPMKEETRQLLQDFFVPYNHRLALLLKRYGFNDDGDWTEPLWINTPNSGT